MTAESPTTEMAEATTPAANVFDPSSILDDLEAGRVRAAEPDPSAPDGWHIRPEVKTAILALFADRTATRLDGRAAHLS